MKRALAIASAVALLSVPTASAQPVPESVAADLAHLSVALSPAEPSFVPGVDAYDAEWFARLRHGQAHLVRFTSFNYSRRTAWLIVIPNVKIPLLGARRPPYWVPGTAYSFWDAVTGRWLFTAAVGRS